MKFGSCAISICAASAIATAAWATCCCYKELNMACDMWVDDESAPWDLERTCNNEALSCPDDIVDSPNGTGARNIYEHETGNRLLKDGSTCMITWYKMKCSQGFCVPIWPQQTLSINLLVPDTNSSECGG